MNWTTSEIREFFDLPRTYVIRIGIYKIEVEIDMKIIRKRFKEGLVRRVVLKEKMGWQLLLLNLFIGYLYIELGLKGGFVIVLLGVIFSGGFYIKEFVNFLKKLEVVKGEVMKRDFYLSINILIGLGILTFLNLIIFFIYNYIYMFKENFIGVINFNPYLVVYVVLLILLIVIFFSHIKN